MNKFVYPPYNGTVESYENWLRRVRFDEVVYHTKHNLPIDCRRCNKSHVPPIDGDCKVELTDDDELWYG